MHPEEAGLVIMTVPICNPRLPSETLHTFCLIPVLFLRPFSADFSGRRNEFSKMLEVGLNLAISPETRF